MRKDSGVDEKTWMGTNPQKSAAEVKSKLNPVHPQMRERKEEGESQEFTETDDKTPESEWESPFENVDHKRMEKEWTDAHTDEGRPPIGGAQDN